MCIKHNIVKTLLFVVTEIAALYIVTSYGLTFTELHFREWVETLGILRENKIFVLLSYL